jgi:hypothetical protein
MKNEPLGGAPLDWRMPSPETNSKLTLSDVYSFIMDIGFHM